MDQTLINVIVGSVITLAGVLIISLFNRSNIKLQQQNQKDLENEKLIREQLQAIHAFVTKWYFFEANFTPEEKELVIEGESFLLIEFRKEIPSLFSLTLLYAPELIDQFMKFIKNFGEYQRAIITNRNGKLANVILTETKATFDKNGRNFYEELQAKILKEFSGKKLILLD